MSDPENKAPEVQEPKKVLTLSEHFHEFTRHTAGIIFRDVFLRFIEFVEGAFVFSKGWSWFVVQSFHMPEITTRQAMGISLTIAAIVIPYKISNMFLIISNKHDVLRPFFGNVKFKNPNAYYEGLTVKLLTIIVYMPTLFGVMYLVHRLIG